MLLRPRQLNKTFQAQTAPTTQNTRGGRKREWVDTVQIVGVLAEANASEREKWHQMQHPITHQVVSSGAPAAKEGDRLVLDGRHFYIQGVDNPGDLDLWTIYRCEERQDE